MQREIVKINNAKGLHARPASQLLKAALHYQSDIQIEYNHQSGNAKSITSILRLAIPGGSEVSMVAHGQDEGEALADLKVLLQEALID